MPNTKYEIKITGSGTRQELSDMLRSIADEVTTTESIDGATWEDHILITEIKEI